MGDVRVITIDAASQRVAFGDDHGTVIVRRVSDGSDVMTVELGEAVREIRFATTGATLGVVTMRGQASIIDATTREVVTATGGGATVTFALGEDFDAAFSADGTLLAVTDTSGTRFFDARDATSLWRLDIPGKNIAFGPDGDILVTDPLRRRCLGPMQRLRRKQRTSWKLAHADPHDRRGRSGDRPPAMSSTGCHRRRHGYS